MTRGRDRIDSGLLAVVVLVLITSGALVLSIAGEKVEEQIVVLRNLYPERLYPRASVTSRQRMDFAISLLLRQDFVTLELQYSTLVQAEPIFQGNGTMPPGSLREIAAGIDPIASLGAETENQHLLSTILEVPVGKGDQSFRGLFYDFPLIRFYTKTHLSPRVFTSFLVVENGSDTLYFEGYSDFFLDKLDGFADQGFPEIVSSLEKLRIWRGEEAVSYSSTPGAPGDWLGIEESPPFGRVTFRDVLRNEKVSVEFTVETPERPEGMIAQVVRIFGDGELLEVIANIVE